MKLQIDFDNKIIKVETSVNLVKLYNKLREMLPNLEEFTLQTNTEIIWKQYYEPRPYWYWDNNIVYCGSSTSAALNINGIADGTYMLPTSGSFNLEFE